MTHSFASLALFPPSVLLAIAAPIAGDVGARLPRSGILLPATAQPAVAQPEVAQPEIAQPEIAQLTIRERIIIRVPKLRQSMSPGRMPIPVPPGWKEKKGPKCIAAADLAGAMISQPGSVDLVLDGGDRVRAVLDDDCGPLDYYGGYYLRPASDGQICADRDVIRVRSGRSCMIAKFRRLVPTR
ncbi:MAG: hypothetical protein M3R64_06910 [Pseudomonadota bacterium]|nr:hypothetical protein [Pseudomonadota bacterium]